MGYRLSSHFKKIICHLQCIKKKGSQNVFKPLWWNQMSILKYSDVLITALGNLTMFFSCKNRRNIRVSECPRFLFILIGAIKICFEIKARRQKTIAMFFPLLTLYLNIANIAENPQSLYVLTCILPDYLCQVILIEG